MSATLQEAIAQSDWFCRYALDRLSSDPRHLHPGVSSHLHAAEVQLRAVIELVKPCHDTEEAPVMGYRGS